jgi:hypothetical protein
MLRLRNQLAQTNDERSRQTGSEGTSRWCICTGIGSHPVSNELAPCVKLNDMSRLRHRSGWFCTVPLPKPNTRRARHLGVLPTCQALGPGGYRGISSMLARIRALPEPRLERAGQCLLGDRSQGSGVALVWRAHEPPSVGNLNTWLLNSFQYGPSGAYQAIR